MEIDNQINLLKWHPTRRWSTRELSRINKIIIHQELGNSPVKNVNNYHISPNHISPKGCPHFCYHFGIEENGKVIQANEFSHITWHTKGQNSVSIGIMLVGDFAGPGHNTETVEPKPEQIKSLKELITSLQKDFNLTNQDVFGHYHYGKPACPGFIIQEEIEKIRNDLSAIPSAGKVVKSIKEIQKRLNKHGYACGKVDGIMGVNTQAAIRAFQVDNSLDVDGVVGPHTRSKLLSLT